MAAYFLIFRDSSVYGYLFKYDTIVLLCKEFVFVIYKVFMNTYLFLKPSSYLICQDGCAMAERVMFCLFCHRCLPIVTSSFIHSVPTENAKGFREALSTVAGLKLLPGSNQGGTGGRGRANMMTRDVLSPWCCSATRQLLPRLYP